MSLETGRVFSPVLDEKMLQTLNEVYEEVVVRSLKREIDGACSFVSTIVNGRTDLQLAGGKFIVDTPYEKGDPYPWHFWCVDGLGRIVDLTTSQFNGHLDESIPGGVLIVNPEDGFYKRYIKGTMIKTDAKDAYPYELEMPEGWDSKFSPPSR